MRPYARRRCRHLAAPVTQVGTLIPFSGSSGRDVMPAYIRRCVRLSLLESVCELFKRHGWAGVLQCLGDTKGRD